MVFYIGCALILAGVFMIGRYYYHASWNKVDGTIEEIIQEDKNWWSKKPSKIVTVTYYFNSERFEKKRTYIIAQDVQMGQQVKLLLNPKNPKDFHPKNHKLELVWGYFIIGLGILIIWGCIFLLDTFNAW